MSEFKGTKGTWCKNYRNGSWLIQDIESFTENSKGCIAEVYWFNDGNDTAEANALLISYAPEMLEALQKVLDTFYPVQDSKKESEQEEVLKQIEELIKEATELK